jgi:hypothetical protein
VASGATLPLSNALNSKIAGGEPCEATQMCPAASAAMGEGLIRLALVMLRSGDSVPVAFFGKTKIELLAESATSSKLGEAEGDGVGPDGPVPKLVWQAASARAAAITAGMRMPSYTALL